MDSANNKTEDNFDDNLLQVSILAPEHVVFEGKVTSLTCQNIEGMLDILPYHANFISLIFEDVTLVLPSGKIQTIPVGNALLRQMSNQITILTNVKLNEYDHVIERKSIKNLQ